MTTPTVLPTWDLPGFPGGQTDSSGVTWWVDQNDVTGWYDPPDVRLAHVDRVGRHGVWRSANTRAARVIVIPGRAWATTQQAIDAAVTQFGSLLADGGTDMLTVTERDGSVWTAEVELGARPQLRRTQSRAFEYQLTVVAADPRKHGPWRSALTHLPVDPTGGLNASPPGLNASAPGLDAGTSGSRGLVSVTNTGKAAVSPLITFTGPLSAPSLTDTTTGDVLSYTGDLLTGEQVVINTDDFPVLGYPAYSVLLGGTADRGNLLSLVGDWPVVQPGQTSQWVLRAATNNLIGTAEVAIRPAIW